MDSAYLDHAATSPLRPEVAEAMAPFGAERFGNPSGSHRIARDARRALEDAREVVASHLGAAPAEVVFTSGGTEADNLAILGTVMGRAPATIVCSAVEHAAVLEACRSAGRLGMKVVVAEVDRSGALDVGGLEELLEREAPVAIVSVMVANNEVGTVQPLAAVAESVRRLAPAAVLHADAVQAAAWFDLTCAPVGSADLVAVSAHKLGGPKGAGALVARRGAPLSPLLVGGGQEHERRSGTVNVAGAVGLAAAMQAVARDRDTAIERVRALRDRLADGLLAAVEGATESAPRDAVLPGHCHLRFAGVEQEDLLLLLDEAGVCAAAGSACASGALEPSHVLLAMGVPAAEARSGVRFTLGYSTSRAEIETALAAVPPAVARLRGQRRASALG